MIWVIPIILIMLFDGSVADYEASAHIVVPAIAARRLAKDM
jgi:hypothetical protein